MTIVIFPLDIYGFIVQNLLVLAQVFSLILDRIFYPLHKPVYFVWIQMLLVVVVLFHFLVHLLPIYVAVRLGHVILKVWFAKHRFFVRNWWQFPSTCRRRAYLCIYMHIQQVGFVLINRVFKCSC